ncbi:hypothetical protein [Cerasicoccus frondis]|uniref:hypothetical protein n=1 Tax=Cerasicoccus frondis TaxID=490090 RepID=UPI002852B517|nr:hypothetical protein [Cerasicoccus frondis]
MKIGAKSLIAAATAAFLVTQTSWGILNLHLVGDPTEDHLDFTFSGTDTVTQAFTLTPGTEFESLFWDMIDPDARYANGWAFIDTRFPTETLFIENLTTGASGNLSVVGFSSNQGQQELSVHYGNPDDSPFVANIGDTIEITGSGTDVTIGVGASTGSWPFSVFDPGNYALSSRDGLLAGNLNLEITAIPEPSTTVVIFALAGLSVLWIHERRLKS